MPEILADTEAVQPGKDYTASISGILLWNEQKENETLRTFGGTIFPVSSVERPSFSTEVILKGRTIQTRILDEGLVKGRGFRDFIKSRTKRIFVTEPDIKDITVFKGIVAGKVSPIIAPVKEAVSSLKTFGIIVIIILALFLAIRLAGFFK